MHKLSLIALSLFCTSLSAAHIKPNFSRSLIAQEVVHATNSEGEESANAVKYIFDSSDKNTRMAIFEKFAKEFSDVAELELRDEDYSAEELNFLLELPQLKTLSLPRDDLSAEKLEIFSKCPQLTRLELSQENCNKVNFDNLKALNLKYSLRLEGHLPIDKVAMESLPQLETLDTLTIIGFNLQKHPIKKTVQKLTNIKELEIIDCSFPRREDLSLLYPLKNLETLTLIDSPLSSQNLCWLASFPQLQDLCLVDCFLDSRSEILFPEKHSNLKTIALDECNFTRNSLNTLKNCPNLNFFTLLDAKNIDDASLSNFTPKNFPCLEGLILGNCTKVSTKGLEQLLENPGIKCLGIDSNTHVNDYFMKTLLNLPKLEVLMLSNCPNISSDGLLQLTKHPQLKYIELEENDYINAEVIDVFQEIREDVYVEFYTKDSDDE